MKYFTIKEIALIAVLAAVVSTVEISIGSFMHAFNLHGKSIVLTTTAMIIYFTAFSITKKRGTVITIGFITAFIKLVYGWEMSKLSPVLSILGESIVTEIILCFLPLNVITGAITGASLKIFNLVFPFISFWIIGGKTAGKNLSKLFDSVQRIFPSLSFPMIVIAGIIWTIILGCILGYIAFMISKQVTKLHDKVKKKKSKKEEKKEEYV